jgi:hypothetical protein
MLATGVRAGLDMKIRTGRHATQTPTGRGLEIQAKGTVEFLDCRVPAPL